jgi:hypothetical protein
MQVSSALILGLSIACAGCVSDVQRQTDRPAESDRLVIGRAIAIITGQTSRVYGPEVRWLELENRRTQERITVELKSQDRVFSVLLPAGDYRLNRIQISEGPFLSIADMNATFSVGAAVVTHVGTWRFGIEPPRYGRKVALSIVMEEEGLREINALLPTEHPERRDERILSVVPEPPTAETRLYEVMPYPRYPRYFQRHNY